MKEFEEQQEKMKFKSLNDIKREIESDECMFAKASPNLVAVQFKNTLLRISDYRDEFMKDEKFRLDVFPSDVD
eukprot:Nk52_evm1s2379 gene=Nk52_evmTU1s2379